MIIQSFKILLGDGRAWRLMGVNISAVARSAVKLLEDVRYFAYRIMFVPFLTQNTYASVDDKLLDLKNYEELFELDNVNNKTLVERQEQVESQWGLVGGQSWLYIEKVLSNAGLKCKVRENIPLEDVTQKGVFVYGGTINDVPIQYGGTVNDVPVQYGGYKYKLIANGDLNINGYNNDPVLVNDYSSCFFIEFSEPITSGQYDNFLNLLLRVKPAHLGVLVKVSIY